MSGATYREVQVKGALNAVKGMPFEWSLNPFLGCVHACSYCFARAYHARYRERNVGTDFDRDIEVRVNIADVLRHELRQAREGSLAIGTATDPYQPVEGKYRLTRRCLEALVERPLSTSIITKGPLIVRDIDVLSELDRRADLTIYFSVPCVDEDVVRRTDPGTARARCPRTTARAQDVAAPLGSGGQLLRLGDLSLALLRADLRGELGDVVLEHEEDTTRGRGHGEERDPPRNPNPDQPVEGQRPGAGEEQGTGDGDVRGG